MASEMKLLHLLFSPGILPCHIHSRFLVNLASSEETFIQHIQNIVRFGLRWRQVLLIHDDLLLNLLYFALFIISKQTRLESEEYVQDSSVKSIGKVQGVATGKHLHGGRTGASNPNDGESAWDTTILASADFKFLHGGSQSPQAANSSLLDPRHRWFLLSDSTCQSILARPTLRHSNTILMKPTNFAQSAAYSKCPRYRLDKDKSFIASRAHLLSVGVQILLKGSLTHMPWSCVDQSPLLKDYPGQFLDYITLANRDPDKTRKHDFLTLTTNEGEVTVDLATRLVSSMVFEFCSTDSQAESGYTFRGDWEMWNHLHPTSSMFANVFTDFANATLVIATNPAPPFVIKTMKEGEAPSYTGFCIDLLDEFAKRLKFRYQIVESHDGQFGSMNEDSTWSGVIGMVIQKKAALGIGPFSITSTRKNVVDFTTAFAEDGTGILTRRPGYGSSKMFQLFKPFEPLVWGCLVCSVIVSSMALYLVNRTSPFAGRGFSNSVPHKLTMFYCFWAILASSVSQGTNLHPMSTSARLVLGFWWVFIILVVSTYTASLAAVLTVNIYEKSIRSLSELAAQTEITPLIKRGTNLQTLFQTATDDVYRSVASRLVIFPDGDSNEKAVAWVRDRNMAFMTDRSQLEYLMQAECEAYALVPEVFNSGGLGFVTPKDAPFLDAFNLIIVKLRQSGIIERWRSRWWAADGTRCMTGTRVGEGQQLGLVYLAGPFFVFLGAILLSVLVALADWAWRAGKLRLRRWAVTSG
ncbi:hypothetical protein EGW08_016177 [Elysia chlorotica]|uniref:Glutamate receptor n=1 Tax=Elysia chlorotica TaxID=188477 RepID=A0A3S0ZV71_ELYCH|nr:hypothetical protein EGW08_016177 [Elysia chlorotica]